MRLLSSPLVPTRSVGTRMVLGLILSAVTSAVEAQTSPADSNADSPRVFSVSRTFDDSPFRYRMKLISQKTGYRVYRLTYPSPVVTPVEQNNTIPADFYLPDGIDPNGPKRPAVICLHILEGNFELVHMTCSVLASRGIPAVMFKLPYYGERSLPGGRDALAGNPKLLVEALSQGLQDVRRTIDVLASRPEIDPQRIGITGISMGGILAATAAGADSRVSRAVLILSGGDLMRIIHHARETKELSQLIRSLPAQQRAELERTIDAIDPLRHAARLRDRAKRGKVLMINAAEDNVIPKQYTEKLAAALGMTDRVIWLEGLGHYTAMAALPQALQTTADFFAQDLPLGVKTATPPAPRRKPLHLVVSLTQQAGAFLVSEPKPGRCHFADLKVSVTLQDGENIDATLRLVRGTRHKFSIHLKVPKFGRAALGQGTYPWMTSGNKVVFKGVLPPDMKTRDPLAFADPQHVLKLRMFSGLLAALALAPDTLETWVTVEEETAAGGSRAVRITNKRKKHDNVRLVLKDDGKTPAGLTFDVGGVRGTITFRAWQLNTVAHDALFAPPGKLPGKRVDPSDLYRMFSALFNFAMENVE